MSSPDAIKTQRDSFRPPDRSFFGVPVQTEFDALEADFAFLGIPFGSPYDMRGVHGECADAPRALREATWAFGYARELRNYDFDLRGPLVTSGAPRLVDCGDVPGDPRDLAGNKRTATHSVRRIIDRGAMPIIVGGDDSLPPIVARALELNDPLRVLQIDAHLDFRAEVNGVSDGSSSPMRRLRDLPHVADVIQVGLRSVRTATPEDYEAAVAAGNVLITAEELHTGGVSSLLDRLPTDGAWLISIDCDGLDPTIAPGVEYPEPGGLTYAEALALLRGIATTRRIAAIEFTEYAPAFDARSITALTLLRLIVNFIGASTAAAASPTTQRELRAIS